MEIGDPRPVLDRLVQERGESYAALSRMLQRNDAYLQQFVKRGTPRLLAERDRKLLARYFGVDDAVLGGAAPVPPAPVIGVRLLDVAASAGPGRLVDAEHAAATLPFDRGMLERLGIRSTRLAMIDAHGDSMRPLIEHGDQIMVDEADTRVGARGGIYVIRLDGVLMVKRVTRAGDRMTILSDNPDFPAIGPRPAAEVEIVGKVVWLSRSLR
ncbi:helix-turn-helix transcriptional regulator [Sphingomonas qilianensis]|uniref:S24 family peptidase n=1 Tax=Sphingomonas qilianensis TaxID=1736690 RepID=A0ABU9XPL2_9SPHN